MAHSLQQFPCAHPGDGEGGERSTLWVFPGGVWGTWSWANIRHKSLQWAVLLFLGSSQGQEGDDNAHFCLRHLRHCLRHHWQFSPYISALDMRKYSFECLLQRDSMSSPGAASSEINNSLFSTSLCPPIRRVLENIPTTTGSFQECDLS